MSAELRKTLPQYGGIALCAPGIVQPPLKDQFQMARIETIEDAREWIAAHDAKIDAYWDAQREFNKRLETRTDLLLVRVTAVEKKVIWWSGFAAAMGALMGGILQTFF